MNVKSKLRSKKELKIPPHFGDFLSTGSTLLNLACAGHPDWGLRKGTYSYLVGDTNSGKSWFAHSCLAEASINPAFDDYRLIFDNSESGAFMDIRRFFGSRLVDRLEPPAGTKEEPIFSSTIEDFYFNLMAVLNGDKSVVYVLDSMDSVSSDPEIDKFEEKQEAVRKKRDKGKTVKVAGSYGDGKAKINSSSLRIAHNKVVATNSILIVIGQSRDRIGYGAQFDPKTHAGGNAISFYSNCKIWFSIKEKLKGSYEGKPVEIGTLSKIRVRRTRITGRDRTVCVPIYHSVGIDDLGSMVDWLIEWKHWTEAKGIIDAQEFNLKVGREKLVHTIEEQGKERELKDLTALVWGKIEEAIAIQRKSRYDN
ncbi:MAG: hypothetical protein KGL39_00945 [Patescibacteria group bacterium]|nr:hypothetical protein [Patescibacteria group bacterium]